MTRQFYNVGDTFVDKESGKTLRCVKGYCGTCFYSSKPCGNVPECRPILRETNDSVCFISTELSDSTQITSEILSRNGWENTSGDIFRFSDIVIEHIDGFCTQCEIGKPFITIGELKAIAKALYKVELKFV